MHRLTRGELLIAANCWGVHEPLCDLVLRVEDHVVRFLKLNGLLGHLSRKETNLGTAGPILGEQKTIFYVFDCTFEDEIHDKFDGYINNLTMDVVLWVEDGHTLLVKRHIVSRYGNPEYSDVEIGEPGTGMITDLCMEIEADFHEVLEEFCRRAF